MEPRGLLPWEVAVICVVLIVAAYVMGSSSPREDDSRSQGEKKEFPLAMDLERLRRDQETERRETSAQLQKLALELQTGEASRKLERQALQHQQEQLREQLQDAKAKLREEEEARQSLQKTLRQTEDQLRELEQDHKALERRFQEELSSLRAGMQNVSYTQPSPRVLAQTWGTPQVLTGREARVQEWRRRFEESQMTRDAANERLGQEREQDFHWATSLLNVEEGTIEWPSLLNEPKFVAFRSQAESAIRQRDLKKLGTAATDALAALESRAREHGRSTEQYLSAKRFLSVLKNLPI